MFVHRYRAVLAIAATSVVLAVSGIVGGCGSDFEESAFDPNAQSSGTSGASGTSGGFQTDAGSSGSSGSSGNTNNCVAPAAVTLTPASLSKDVTPGTPFSQVYQASADGKDVTSQVLFTVSDTNVGTMTGSTFNWGGKFGGALTIKAMYCGVVGTAALNLKILAPPFTAGPGSGTLPGVFATAPASTNVACKPILKYPPDQILLPPNTNVIEVHFLKAGNTQFEIAFTNAVTDVRIYTTCTAPPLVGGEPDVANGAPAPAAPGGCLFELNQAEWDFIANTNREGAPLNVGVRGIGCDGANAAGSDSRSISFARQDVIGTIYYWASIRIGGNENSGGVYRYDYGKRGQTAEAVLTPVADAAGNGPKYFVTGVAGEKTHALCVGCHIVDREGRKMTFDFDDNDDDDEYGDMWTAVFDIPSRTSTSEIKKGSVNSFSAGFSTWNRTGLKFLKSDGWGNGIAGVGAGATPYNGPRGTFHIVSNAGAPVGKTTPTPLVSLRGTSPDIAPDDKKVVFSAMADQVGGPTTPGFFGASSHTNVAPDDYTDEYFTGAGLYIGNWDSTAQTMTGVTPIFPAAAANAINPGNYYYPAYSPEGSLVAFNFAASGANFHNPKARMQLVTASGGIAADQVRANATNPVENGGELTNSWVRWAPFVQPYKGKNLAWVTYSSTRSYGLRIDNNAKVDCHPTENPDKNVYPEFTGNNAANCSRAQLWMAAIDLDAAKVAIGGDVSFPAFWLPFQDKTTQNHLGQWTQKNFKGTCALGDAGTCPPGYICDNGGCAAVPPPSTNPKPQADCSQNVQCPTGLCCTNGVCGACGAAKPPTSCSNCLDCGGQACLAGGTCGGCTTSAQCCAPLLCINGTCEQPVK